MTQSGRPSSWQGQRNLREYIFYTWNTKDMRHQQLVSASSFRGRFSSNHPQKMT
jgi:hypothetical protein